MTCIGQPVSWLRLETFAAGATDRELAEHVAACPACAGCLAELRADVVALPPLASPATAPRRPWWYLAPPALALVAAAIVLVIAWPRDVRRDDVARVKGVGEVILGVVRERGGVIRDDATTFRSGDRWKVVVTCPPRAAVWVDVDVGGDRPLAPARIACGNRVVVPGAFELTGDRANRICVRLAAGAPPTATKTGACVTISAEP